MNVFRPAVQNILVILYPAVCTKRLCNNPEHPLRIETVVRKKLDQCERIKKAKVLSGIKRTKTMKYRQKLLQGLMLVRTRLVTLLFSAIDALYGALH